MCDVCGIDVEPFGELSQAPANHGFEAIDVGDPVLVVVRVRVEESTVEVRFDDVEDHAVEPSTQHRSCVVR